MRRIMAAAVAAWCCAAGVVSAQTSTPVESGWRTPSDPPDAPARFTPDTTTSNGGETALVSRTQTVRAVQHASGSNGTLPHEAGQVWREYDISPYTSRVSDIENPQKAVVDWILRDTGSDVWFGEPLGILSATQNTLRVYHTPAMQRTVSDIVDRFVHTSGESYLFSLRVVSVSSPNWRVQALPQMRSVNVQTPGVEAWLVSKEDVGVILDDLARRNDFREYNSPNLLIPNGQSQVITRTQPVQYPKSLLAPEDAARTGQLVEIGQINEGFSLQFSPLLSLDGSMIDAAIKCEADQIERFAPLTIDVPNGVQRQRVSLQVPQMASWRLHERFRWPAGQVLVVSCGLVAAPDPGQAGGVGAITQFLSGASDRADVLLFIEGKGPARTTIQSETASSQSGELNTRGRY